MAKTLSKTVRVTEDAMESRRKSGQKTQRIAQSSAGASWRWRPLVVTNGPEPRLEIQLLRSTLFTAQAMARDMIANGREHEVEEIRKEISKFAPELPD